MHIIALENEASSARGGQELSLLDVCRGLSNSGHKVTLLYTKQGDLLQQYREFSIELIKINAYRLSGKNFTYSLRNFLLDNIKIKTTKDTIVYANQYQDSFFGYTLALSKNIPFVCHLRLPPPSLKMLGFDTLGLQTDFGMFGAKSLIAVSQQTKQDWVKRGFKDKKIEVVYNGINPERFPQINLNNPEQTEQTLTNKKTWDIPDNTQIISYVGRLDKEKGIETLIKGFALFLQTGKKAKLLIAGKPLRQGEDYKKQLQQLTIDLKIENHVKFVGHLQNTTSLYQISDINVISSLHSEPFGRTVIESMACGTPVVGSRTGGITEILSGEFQKGLFDPGNAQDLSNKLSEVSQWKNLDTQLSKKCRQHILSNFHVDQMVKGVENVLLNSLNY
jgi:glycosyltransferase involved in cell wall biosynthesis